MLFTVTVNLNCDGGMGRGRGAAVVSFTPVTDIVGSAYVLAESRSGEDRLAMPGSVGRTWQKESESMRIFFRLFDLIWFDGKNEKISDLDCLFF